MLRVSVSLILTQLVGVFNLFSKLVILLSLLFDTRHGANWAVRDVTYGRSNFTVFKLYFSKRPFVHCASYAWFTHSFVLPAVSLPLAPLASDWAFPAFFSFFWDLSFFWSDMTASIIYHHFKHKLLFLVSWRHKKPLFIKHCERKYDFVCREQSVGL